VICSPPGASSRLLSEFHGVTVGGATSTAPVVGTARTSSTSNATRSRGATARPTSTSSMYAR
jgi:hypothetical protein